MTYRTFDGTSQVETITSGRYSSRIADDEVGSEHIEILDANLQLSDNVKIQLGTSSDLNIYHNATNSYLDNNTGDLYLRVNTSENAVKALANGATELYYDNDRKLKTASNGAIIESGTGDTYFTVQTEEDASSADAVVRAWTKNTDASCYLMFGDIDDTFVGGFRYTNSDDKLMVYTNNATHWQWDSSGNFLSNSDSTKLQLGAAEDFEIWHDGSTNILDGIRHPIELRHGAEVHIKCVDDGTVELYNNNSKKLETTGSGVTVTGTVTETSDIALKTDIKQISNSLANLKQLTGYSYKFKETGIASLGLTAQDVEKVYPELVKGEEGSKSLTYSGLIAPLIEAIKELSAEVETLKTKVTALEST